jgi:NAD(P)-dependent dehydrogenase (short-subunit alcohol dehydrogenase family)
MLNNIGLDRKIAVVTGAGGEIGAATIQLMAARGARIVAVDRDAKALERLKAGLDPKSLVAVCEADVTNEASVRRYVALAVDWAKRIDIFFNNAGIEGPVHPIADYPLDDFRRVFDVNVIGVFLASMLFRPSRQLAVAASSTVPASQASPEPPASAPTTLRSMP